MDTGTFAEIALRARREFPEYERHPWLNAQDEFGRPHVLYLPEAHIHTRTHRCACSPQYRRGVINHRRMRNSRALFKPWEAGH